MLTHYPLLAARPHDLNHLGALIEGFDGVVPEDLGFLDQYQQSLWHNRQGAHVVTPARAKMLAASRTATGEKDETLAEPDRNG